MVQVNGILDGAGGQALAQMLAGGGQQQQRQESTMFDKMPSLMQAMSYAQANEARSQAAMGELAIKQKQYEDQQGAYNAIMTGDDPIAQRAANYGRAGMDSGLAQDVLGKVLGAESEDRKANALKTWTQELQIAQREGVTPEKAVPLVLERMRADKVLWQGFAEAVGSTTEGLDKAQNQALENLKRGEQDEATIFFQDAIDALTADGKKGDGLAVMLRKPEFLLSYLPKKMVDAAVQYSAETPPPQGMTPEQWTQRNVDIARRNSMIMTNNQGKKGQQSGLDAFKAVVGIMNESYEPFFNQQQIDNAGERNDIARIAANKPRGGGRTSEPANYSTAGMSAEEKAYDFNHNGVLDKGRERDMWKIGANNGEFGPKQQTGNTTATQSIEYVPQPTRGRDGRPAITTRKETTTGKSVSGGFKPAVGSSLARVKSRLRPKG